MLRLLMEHWAGTPYQEWPPMGLAMLREECEKEFKRRRVGEEALYRCAHCPCGNYAVDEEEFSSHWLEHIRPNHVAAPAPEGQLGYF